MSSTALACALAAVLAAVPSGARAQVQDRPLSEARRPALPEDDVERELAARALALGHSAPAAVDAWLVSDDWTWRHLALDALARTPAARARARSEHLVAVSAALRDPRPELRVAALEVLGCAGLDDDALRALARDPSPAVVSALVRALVCARAGGPSPTLEPGCVDALLAAFADRTDVATSPGAPGGGPLALDPQAATLARRCLVAHGGARLGSDVALVSECFDELVALPDDELRELALALAARCATAGTPAEGALALAVLAHTDAFGARDAERFAALAPEYLRAVGLERGGAVLRRCARLAGERCAGFFAAAARASGDERELLARCAAESFAPATALALPLDAPSDLLVACLASLLTRGVALDGAALERFADAPDLEVRGAAFSCAHAALRMGDLTGAVPLLARLLEDPSPELAEDAFRALAGPDGPEELEPTLCEAWRTLPTAEARARQLRDLARTRRWPSFAPEVLPAAAAQRDPALIGLLAPLATEPAVAEALARWFVEDVAAIEASDAPTDKFLHDARAAAVAGAFARTARANVDVVAELERALRATMQRLHGASATSTGDADDAPAGVAAGARPKLPKTLVALLAESERGRGALARVLADAAPSAPRRVRTEAAIQLALRGDDAAGTALLTDALVAAVTESEPELAVRAVQALLALESRAKPRTARDLPASGVGRLLARWDELRAESVRIALVEGAAAEPLHYRALERIVFGRSDDTVAAMAIEAAAASERGEAVSLAALATFEGLLRADALRSSGATPRVGAGADRTDARAHFAGLSAEQALVRREAVLLGFARRATPCPDEVAARCFQRPLVAARADLAEALAGEQGGGAEFRYRGELALGEALARGGALGALLARTPGWWNVDAHFLAALARRAGMHEPGATARIAEAALVALQGLPVPRAERAARIARTELSALALAATARAGEARAASGWAGDLAAGMRRMTLARGLDPDGGRGPCDPRGLDARTLERMFGALDPRAGVDPRARLEAARWQFAALASREAGEASQAATLLARGARWARRSREAAALQAELEGQ